MKKSKLMLRVEREWGEPLEVLLPKLISDKGQSATAGELDVSKATLGYWLLRLGLRVVTVVLRPGETLEIRQSPEMTPATLLHRHAAKERTA